MEPPDKRRILYIVLLAVALIISYVIGFLVFKPKIAQEPFVSLESCFYQQPNIVYIPEYQVLGSLVDCLVEAESGGNPQAVGKSGEIGVLQFMPSTFQSFCVDKYGYRDNIWNLEIQRDCCAEMIANGGINHWTTKELCQNTFVKNAVEQ